LETDDYINLPKTTSDHRYFAIDGALRRKIKEETGLEIGKLKYLCDITFIHPDGSPGVILSFYRDCKSGDVKLNEDNINYAYSEFGWF
jgi:ADP-ribose pyrophosphatase YjhB (NUDIX family)